MAYQTIFGSQNLGLAQSAGLAAESILKDTKAAIGQGKLSSVGSAAAFRVAQFAGAWVGHRADPDETRQIVRRMYYPR